MRHPAMPAPGRRCLECVRKAKSEVKRVRREKGWSSKEQSQNPRRTVRWANLSIASLLLSLGIFPNKKPPAKPGD
jgi:hypothetical protein